MILSSEGSEKERVQEESSTAVGDAEPNPEPVEPRQAGLEAPPILEDASGAESDWPDLPGPEGPGDADFEQPVNTETVSIGNTEADTYMDRAQYDRAQYGEQAK